MNPQSTCAGSLARSSDESLEDCSIGLDNEKGALLPWEQPTARQRSQNCWRWTFLTLSHIIVAVLTCLITKQLSAGSCIGNERISPFMSNIDRGFHQEIGNAATAVSSDPGNSDANNHSWNNFTVSAETGGDSIEDWWLDLGTYSTPVLVPERYAKDFNFDPDKHAIVRPDDPEYAPGDVPYVGYPASIEVMHKLHCLDFLRQAAWYNHEYYRSIHGGPWRASEHDLVRHVGHCVDIFRQKLICEAEIELVPFSKSENHHVRNDWARPKQCRNFESVRSWLAEHQWPAGDSEFHLDDHHQFDSKRITFTRTPIHSHSELWRGF
ncbi:hypothetical protein TI39_contig146g00001 [Zymoseptoria brevis]|uniref:Uncharacterized protein n=1 Tax=Zymoseptoria brevis TaxID=1047168 RepID=A0A0F4GY15_9PEZI|nr:hypothetical protein TI39_contig146g00001 [Zymoseptoria brevis]